MNTVNLLVRLVEHHQTLVYFFFFIGLVFEGDVVLICAGILAHLGAVNFWLTMFFLLLGAFGKTFLGYYIGTLLHDKWKHTKFLTYIETRISQVMPHFSERPFWSIFISKFIMGTNQIVTIFSGYRRIDITKYIRAEVIATLIWAPGVMLLGYFFSYTAFSISHNFYRFSLIVLLLVLGFLIVDKLISWGYELFEQFHDHSK